MEIPYPLADKTMLPARLHGPDDLGSRPPQVVLLGQGGGTGESTEEVEKEATAFSCFGGGGSKRATKGWEAEGIQARTLPGVTCTLPISCIVSTCSEGGMAAAAMAMDESNMTRLFVCTRPSVTSRKSASTVSSAGWPRWRIHPPLPS